MGIGLSAAAGFRIFIPLLIASFAASSGYLKLAAGFEWIGSYPAMICFIFATLVEIAAYYIPIVDNLLDTIASPLAVCAGILLSASCMGELTPFLKWTLAVIAGGGAAALTQALTGVTRLASTVTTGATANPIVSTAELSASTALSITSVFIPLIAFLVFMALMIYFINKKMKSIRNRSAA